MTNNNAKIDIEWINRGKSNKILTSSKLENKGCDSV